MPVTNRHTESTPKTPRPGRQGVWRLQLVGAVLGLALLGLSARLFMLQVVDGEEYASLARRQYESRAPLQANRGAIYDRNGTLLATTIPATSFAVDPTHVENPKRLAAAFAEVLGGDAATYLKKMRGSSRSFVWIKRKVLGEKKIARLKALDDDGLIVLTEPLRRFEYGTTAAQLVGCVNLDNTGLSGLELQYDSLLRGKQGYVIMQRDALGRRRPDIDLPRVDPTHGESIQLTIDMTIQSIAEDELSKGVAAAKAASGTVVALDPRTGEILALASWPSFDPNDLANADQSTIRPRGTTDTYEPGSTMKAITAAAAIEEGVVRRNEIINGEGGEWKLDDGSIVRDDHAVGDVSFNEAFRQSSNVVFAKVAERIEPADFYHYIRDFGFGIATGVDLPGEVRGEVKRPERFSEETQAFMAYGYQLSVTPLQLATAYGAIANGGVIMRPHIVKKRMSADGEPIEEIAPTKVRRAVSPTTAAQVRSMLVDVVERGTGRSARFAGMTVAGKTGTAQQLAEGSYTSGRYNSSFVGFFPAERPQIVLLVLLQDPQNGYYGGQVAAPIFSAIARRVINATMVDQNAKVATASTTQRKRRPTGASITPDLRGLDRDGARLLAAQNGLRIALNGKGDRVVRQSPGPGAPTEAGATLSLTVGTREASLPDLRGMTLRRALAILSDLGVEPRITGAGGGIVAGQTPAPGIQIKRKGMTVTLRCR